MATADDADGTADDANDANVPSLLARQSQGQRQELWIGGAAASATARALAADWQSWCCGHADWQLGCFGHRWRLDDRGGREPCRWESSGRELVSQRRMVWHGPMRYIWTDESSWGARVVAHPICDHKHALMHDACVRC